jgi:CubicO group peptidase (beta-lactamase class C family)
MRIATPVLLLLLAFLSPTRAAPAVPDTTVNGPEALRMHRYLQALVPFGFHGTALVAHHDTVLLHQAYGIADPTTGRPNTTGTMFSTGSVTKQFTATAIMKLASLGRLSTDDAITDYIDDVPADKRAITLHHLLTHTAGLRPAYGDDLEVIARDDLVRRIFAAPLDNPPGERFEYSNAGYTLLAVIVEKVTDMPYEEYLRETFYLPNHMTRTGLTSLAIDPSRVARAHNREQGYPSPAERPAGAWNLYGNGGQLSTTGDMYRWIRALRAGELVPHAYQGRMFTGYAAEGPEGRCHYGYGWSICESRRGGDVVWHNGGAVGLWGCAIYQYIDDDAVIIVFTNSTIDGRAPEDYLCVNLSRILFGEPVDLPPDLSPGEHVDASDLAGRYLLDSGGVLVVSAIDGGIAVEPRGQEAITALFPSPVDDRLPPYNDLTRNMVVTCAGGDFERAGADVDMPPDAARTGGQWLQGWWESIDDLGPFAGVEVIGTRFAGQSETYTRLRFERGTRDVCFYWARGRCIGIAPGAAPVRTLRALSSQRFTAFNLDGGVNVEFSGDGGVRLETMGRTVTAERDD